MKIGFDAKRAVCNNTGLGNYSRLIVDVLSDYYPHNHYQLYTPKIKENNRLTPILAKKNVNLITPRTAIARALPSLWRVSSMITHDLQNDRIDLFHGLSNELPLSIAQSGIPSVVTIHDLIFLRYPDYYKPIDRKIYNYKFRKACQNASRIIAITECTKRDIIHYYGIAPEKIDVVYQGCHENFKKRIDQDTIDDTIKKYGLPEDFILYVGTIEERKNLLLAVKALEYIDKDIHLVAVGRCTPYAETVKQHIAAHDLTERVHFYDSIAFNDLPAIYRKARVFVYPSRFEGFGIPILESLCCGTPAIGCTGSCLEEAGGEGAVYVDPDDTESMISALNSLLWDEELHNLLIEKGKQHIKQFTQQQIAENTMAVYQKVLNNE